MARTFLITVKEEDGVPWAAATEDGRPVTSRGEPVPEIVEAAGRLLRRVARTSRFEQMFRLPAATATELGLELASALPENVTDRLREALRRRPVERLDVIFELGEARLHSVPWELLRLPGDKLPVALREGVALYRRVPAANGVPARGGTPPRILFAVAAPDAQASDPRASLDWEHEEGLIGDAVRRAMPQAVFETADEGNERYLRDVVYSLRPHVLHLSGHGIGGGLLLENELGFERAMNLKAFEKFLAKLPDATRLVILSQCLSAAAPKGSVRLADAATDRQGKQARKDLAEEDPFLHFTEAAARLRGYSVGMQFPVADLAASWWAAGFYRALGQARFADLPEAVAAGRRRIFKEIESRRAKAEDPPELDRSDWAAPVLYVAGSGFRLLREEPDRQARRLDAPPNLDHIRTHRDRRAFVGRRRERRELLRVARPGECVGLVLRALGGTGKSTLAAHLIERLAAGGRLRAIYFSGRLEARDTARKLAAELVKDPGDGSPAGRKAIRTAARALERSSRGEGPLEEVLDAACDLLACAQGHGLRLVLAFDDFERNQLPAGLKVPEKPQPPEILDPELRELLRRLAQTAAARGGANVPLLLFAGRFPVPPTGAPAGRWRDIPVGPLGAGEQRKLCQRLLGDHGTTNRPEVWERLGGHPRALEILALIEAMAANDHETEQVLRERFDPQVVRGVEEAAAAGDPLAASIELAARDAGLDALLGQLRGPERGVLAGLGRFGAPFAASACPAVLRAVDDDPQLDQTSAALSAEDALAIWERLTDVGLVAPARHGARLAGSGKPIELWQISRLVRGQMPELATADPAIDAAAARHLKLRLETESMAGSERSGLSEVLVEHGIGGGEWQLARKGATAVLTSLYVSGEWPRGKVLGERWLGSAGAAARSLPQARFAAAVTDRLSMFQRRCGELQAARRSLETAITQLRHYSKGRRYQDRSEETLGNLLGGLLYQLALVDCDQGRKDSARQYFEKAIDISRRTNNRQLHGVVLGALAGLDVSQGRYEDARKRLLEAIDIQERLNDRQGKGSSLYTLANLDVRSGRYDSARRHLSKAIEISKQLGLRQDERASLHLLADLEQRQGHYQMAREHLEESVAIARMLSYPKGYAVSVHALAILDEREGRYDSARERLREALEIARQLDDKEGCAASLQLLGILEKRQDRPEAAREYLLDACNTFKKLGELRKYAASLNELARLDASQGDIEMARKRLLESIEISKELGDPAGFAASLHELADLEVQTGGFAAAERHLEVAIDFMAEIGDASSAALSIMQLGQLKLRQDPVAGLLTLEQAHQTLREAGIHEAKEADKILRYHAEHWITHSTQALEQTEEAAERAVILYLRGICHRLLGRFDEAKEDLDRSLELNRRLADANAVRAVRGQLARLAENEPGATTAQVDQGGPKTDRTTIEVIPHLSPLRGEPDDPDRPEDSTR